MHDLDGASSCPPGRQRPSYSDLNRLHAPSQSTRHQQYSPPGFSVLNDIDGRNQFIEASKSLVFPLSSLEPKLAPDAEAAIDYIVKLGPGHIGVWRSEQRALIRWSNTS